MCMRLYQPVRRIVGVIDSGNQTFHTIRRLTWSVTVIPPAVIASLPGTVVLGRRTPPSIVVVVTVGRLLFMIVASATSFADGDGHGDGALT
jgi:hypothetical protein